MRPSRFTDDQIVQALRQVEAGTPAIQICRKLAITQTTFYRWRRKYGTGGNPPAEAASELLALREENSSLKQLVAEMLLEQRRPRIMRPSR